MEEEIKKMFDTNELNRLQRAAKNKDKREIQKWGQQFENRINQYYFELYKKKYLEWLNESIDDLDIAIKYALSFSEETMFGNKRLKKFFKDYGATLRSVYKREFNRKDYIKMLKEKGIKLEELEEEENEQNTK